MYDGLGDYEHYQLARKHYSASLTMLSPKVNLRALYGLLYTCQALATNDGSVITASKKEYVKGFSYRFYAWCLYIDLYCSQASSNGVSDDAVNAELLSWAKEQLQECADSNKSNAILQIATTL